MNTVTLELDILLADNRLVKSDRYIFGFNRRVIDDYKILETISLGGLSHIYVKVLDPPVCTY